MNERHAPAEPKAQIRPPAKTDVIRALASDESGLRKYQTFFIGSHGILDLVRYEATMLLANGLPGALGYALRSLLYPALFGKAGRKANFGRHIALRCPRRISVGDRVAIDDTCTLDARGTATPDDFSIGDNTLIARDCILVVKSGYLHVGRHGSIGSQTTLSSVTGISIGDHVLIAGQCYIGGGSYKTALGAGPMMEQGFRAVGPVTIGNDVWIAAGARVLSGVTIADGAIIGAGTIVREDVPENAIVVGCPGRIIGYRQFAEPD